MGIRSTVVQSVRPIILKSNYALGQYREVHWIIGSGRSGTTWVSDMLSYHQNLRSVLEPFRPHVVSDSNFLPLAGYVRPQDNHASLFSYYHDVFSGRFQHADVDSAASGFLYKGLMVKDVFANLFAKHVSERFPQVRVSLLLRNPHDVALSQLSKDNWVWIRDPREFLEQSELVEDFLWPFEELIHQVGCHGTQYEKYILNWCISNLVPLRQFKRSELTILFYENFKNDVNKENLKYWGEGKAENISLNVSSKASSVSRQSKNSVLQIADSEFQRGREIVEAFGFADFYSTEGEPNLNAVLKTMGA